LNFGNPLYEKYSKRKLPPARSEVLSHYILKKLESVEGDGIVHFGYERGQGNDNE